MEGNCIYNRANAANSLQISIMGNITGANFSIPDGRGGKEPFLLKNVTEENITVSVILYGMEDPIETNANGCLPCGMSQTTPAPAA